MHEILLKPFGLWARVMHIGTILIELIIGNTNHLSFEQVIDKPYESLSEFYQCTTSVANIVVTGPNPNHQLSIKTLKYFFSKRDENLFLISSGCEVIMMNWSIFERMRNLKVNANLTLLKEKSCILTDEEARNEINRSRTWGNYKSNLITEYTK